MAHIVEEAELRLMLGLADSITEEERGVLMTVHREAERAVKDFLGYDPVQAERTEFYPLRLPAQFQGRGVWDTTGTRAVFEAYDGLAVLQLARIPVRSIDEIRVDPDGRFGQKSGAFPDSSIWTAGDQYFLESEEEGFSMSGQVFAFSAWPVTAGSVKVTYTAGLSRDELMGQGTSPLADGSGITAAVKKAAVKAFTTYRQYRKRSNVGHVGGALTGESMGAYSYSLDPSALAKATGLLTALPTESQQDCERWRNLATLLV